MPVPIEVETSLPPAAHFAGAALSPVFAHDDALADDSHYRDLADRRAQLEDAEILRRARAL
jgi:hypothetical protein